MSEFCIVGAWSPYCHLILSYSRSIGLKNLLVLFQTEMSIAAFFVHTKKTKYVYVPQEFNFQESLEGPLLLISEDHAFRNL